MPEPRHWFKGALLALALAVIASAASSPDSVRRIAFCAPAAHVAGLLSGAPCVNEDGDYRLIGPDLDLIVAPACAAVDYFCLMTGFLSLLVTWRGFGLLAQALVLPAAWALTILVNALRLTACWQTDRLTHPRLPESLWAAPHMAVGVVTFLAGLVLVFWIMTRKKRG